MENKPIKWNDGGPHGEWRMPDLDEREARIRRAFTPAEIEIDSPEYWNWMRGLTRGEKWNQSAQMTTMLIDEIHAEIKAEHPDWNESARNIEFVKRMYGPTLAGHVERWMEKRKNNGDSD